MAYKNIALFYFFAARLKAEPAACKDSGLCYKFIIYKGKNIFGNLQNFFCIGFSYFCTLAFQIFIKILKIVELRPAVVFHVRRRFRERDVGVLDPVRREVERHGGSDAIGARQVLGTRETVRDSIGEPLPGCDRALGVCLSKVPRRDLAQVFVKRHPPFRKRLL